MDNKEIKKDDVKVEEGLKVSEKTNSVGLSDELLASLVDVSNIPIEITAVLGETEMKLSELMELGKGSFIELNTYEDNNVKLFANGKLIAYGLVLAVNQNFGVQITKIVK